MQQELKQLKEAFGAPLAELQDKFAASERLSAAIDSNRDALEKQWHDAVGWLNEFGFIGEAGPPALTPRGRACAAFADGQPLILGTIVSDGYLEQLTAAEICAWVCLFLEGARGMNDIGQCVV